MTMNRLFISEWAVINRTLTHTHPHPAQKRSHPPLLSQKKITSTHTQPKKGYTQPKKGRTHPNPPPASQHKVTPTHTQPKTGHTYPHPAQKRPHSSTPTQTQPRIGTLTDTHPYPAKKRSHPSTPSQKRRTHPNSAVNVGKIFHYPLGNQICQKLKNSSIQIDQ